MRRKQPGRKRRDFGRLDVLVNNAGNAILRRLRNKLEELDRVLISSRAPSSRAGSAEAHEERRPHHHDWLVLGEVYDAGCALLGHEGSSEDLPLGVVQGGGDPGHHGHNIQPGRSTRI